MQDDLLDVLARISDLRRKHGRRCPIQSLLITLILAALNGQSSLRGVWLWAMSSRSGWMRRMGFSLLARADQRPTFIA